MIKMETLSIVRIFLITLVVQKATGFSTPAGRSQLFTVTPNQVAPHKTPCFDPIKSLQQTVSSLAVTAVLGMSILTTQAPVAMAVTQQEAAPIITLAQTEASSVVIPSGGATMLQRVGTTRLQRQASIMDLSSVLNAKSIGKLAQQVENFDKRGTELQILVVDKVETTNPKQLSTALFNKWRLGRDQGYRNGIMVLVVKDSRRVEIEVDRSLNARFPSNWCTKTLQKYAAPEFRKGQYGTGLTETVTQIEKRLDEAGGLNKEERAAILGLVGVVGGGVAFSSAFPYRNDCSNCGATWLQDTTWKTKTQTIRKATHYRSGLRRKRHTCRNCGNCESEDVTIPRKVSSSDSYDSGDSGGGGSDGGGGGSDW